MPIKVLSFESRLTDRSETNEVDLMLLQIIANPPEPANKKPGLAMTCAVEIFTYAQQSPVA